MSRRRLTPRLVAVLATYLTAASVPALLLGGPVAGRPICEKEHPSCASYSS